MLKGLKAVIAASAFSLILGGLHGRPFGTPELATAAGCDLYLKPHVGSGTGDKIFTGPYLAHSTRVLVQVAPNNCAWKIDRSRAGTASWLTTKVISENPQRSDGTYVGSAYIDLLASKNDGRARETAIYFTTSPPGGSSSYASARLLQGGLTDYCQPQPTGASDIQRSIVGPGYLVLTKYGQSTGIPPARVEYRFSDAANCATLGGVIASTPNLRDSSARVVKEAQPNKFLFYHKGVNLPQDGGAILARLGDVQSIWYGRSAVLIRYLLPHSALSPDLRINPETLSQYVVAVSDGGGIVEVKGQAIRSTSNPSRPCAFNPSYYHIVEETEQGRGSQWLKLISGTGCDLGNPDKGKLVISVYPGPRGVSRLGAIYTDWGSAIMIVQR